MNRGLALAAALSLAACRQEAGESPAIDLQAPAAPTATELQASHKYEGPRPDTVVLVMIDTLRADILGAYGSDLGLTPNLDAFANEAALFTNAYGTSSWTRSSVASMLSGRYATSHAVLNKKDVVSEAVELLPEILAADRPTWSFGITTNGNTSAKIGFGQGYGRYGPHKAAERRRYPGDRVGLVPGPAVSELALELLEDTRGEAAETAFAFVQYIDPHDPYFPNPGFVDVPEPPGEFSGSRIDIDRMVAAGEAALTADNIARLRFLYDGEVGFVDQAFGQLIDGLKRLDRFDNAMIIVVSDHGEAFWEHGVRGHGKTLYEEEIRVPFLLRLPGMTVGQVERIDQPVSLVDIAPTVLDALGLQPRPGMEGRSLMPLLAGQERDSRVTYVFAELALMENSSRAMLRHGNLKLLATYWHKRGRNRTELELFDLAADPVEALNLVDDPRYADQRASLMAELSAWESDVSRWAVKKESVDLEAMDQELIEELKGLGYIQD